MRQQLVEALGAWTARGFFVTVKVFSPAEQTLRERVSRQPHCSFIRVGAGEWVEQTTSLVTNCWVLQDRTSEQWGRNMTPSDTPNSATEQKRGERLDVGRTVYHALADRDADRVITLCDIRGRLIARHDLRPEQDAPGSTS